MSSTALNTCSSSCSILFCLTGVARVFGVSQCLKSCYRGNSKCAPLDLVSTIWPCGAHHITIDCGAHKCGAQLEFPVLWACWHFSLMPLLPLLDLCLVRSVGSFEFVAAEFVVGVWPGAF